MVQKLQFVWPKDGPKGRSGHRGFFRGLNDIFTNKGPDIFIQRKGSSTPIKPDWWGNWDSYHDYGCHLMEEGGKFGCSRGYRRYDPYSRRYKTWASPHDWNGDGINGWLGEYPRFTAKEHRGMSRRLNRGKLVDPVRMGKEWTSQGPKRFRQEYDFYWQNTHQRGENRRQGLHPLAGINPFFTMHQRFPGDLNGWMNIESV